MPARTHITELLKSPITLAAAALFVGIAIVWDGAAARALNGVGGILWVACAVVMAKSLRSDPRWWQRGALVLTLALFFAVVVRPSDGLIAIVAFGLGGAAIANVSMPRAVTWSVLLPAMWLPVHLAVAIVSAAFRAITDGEASVRTDPPPTTAIVPLLMVMAAWAGALLVVRFMRARGAVPRAAVERV
jgi:hypothetical protein